ncbi:MAG: hypothetical protein H7Y15_18545 [Pseudonocardia sp.]|nr:hypothetical protein [Pseudonocardia sp.]
MTAPVPTRYIPYLPQARGWAAGTASTGEWLTVTGSARDGRLLYPDRAQADARAEHLRGAFHYPVDIVVRYVEVIYHPGVTLTGVAFRIRPQPADPAELGAAYRAALAADAPSGNACSACYDLHESATAEADCITEAAVS